MTSQRVKNKTYDTGRSRVAWLLFFTCWGIFKHFPFISATRGEAYKLFFIKFSSNFQPNTKNLMSWLILVLWSSLPQTYMNIGKIIFETSQRQTDEQTNKQRWKHSLLPKVMIYIEKRTGVACIDSWLLNGYNQVLLFTASPYNIQNLKYMSIYKYIYT